MRKLGPKGKQESRDWSPGLSWKSLTEVLPASGPQSHPLTFLLDPTSLARDPGNVVLNQSHLCLGTRIPCCMMMGVEVTSYF